MTWVGWEINASLKWEKGNYERKYGIEKQSCFQNSHSIVERVSMKVEDLEMIPLNVGMPVHLLWCLCTINPQISTCRVALGRGLPWAADWTKSSSMIWWIQTAGGDEGPPRVHPAPCVSPRHIQSVSGGRRSRERLWDHFLLHAALLVTRRLLLPGMDKMGSTLLCWHLSSTWTQGVF